MEQAGWRGHLGFATWSAVEKQRALHHLLLVEGALPDSMSLALWVASKTFDHVHALLMHQ
jgi:hypothetical protein